jgi:hypothetical protein
MQSDDETQPSKLEITIINHADPVIQLSRQSMIVSDGVVKWSYPKDGLHTNAIERPAVDMQFPKFEMQSVQHNLGTIEVPGNEYNFVLDRAYPYVNGGIQFVDYTEKPIKEQPKIEFLQHAPGGITNMGSFSDGHNLERLYESGKIYELTITISPGKKIGNNKRDRHCPADYPFLSKDPKRYVKWKDAYDVDRSVWVFKPESKMTYMEMIDKNAWENEHYFGINFDYSVKD